MYAIRSYYDAATTANKGIEFSANIALVQTKKLNINFSFNISANQNSVLSLGNLDSYAFNEAWTSMSEGSNSYISYFSRYNLIQQILCLKLSTKTKNFKQS